MKNFIFRIIAGLATVIAFTGIYPASFCTLYQPETPEELIR